MAGVSKRTWKTGKGEHRQSWQVDYTDETGHRQRKQFKLKKEADAFRVKVEGGLADGTFRGKGTDTTVQEVALAYLEHVTGRNERGERFTSMHLLAVTGHVKNYIAPDLEHRAKRKVQTQVVTFDAGLAAVPLSKLTAGAVGDFRDRLRKAGVRVVTTRKILATLSAILAFAVSRDLVAINAATGVRVIGRRDEGAKKIVPPTKAAMRALIDVASPDFRVELVFAAASGLRAGEHHALRWRHINFAAREVTVETRVDALGEEDTTKTAAGVRTIPLAASVVTMLKEWRLRSKFAKDTDLVFPSREGSYANHANIVKRRFVPLFGKLAALHAAAPEKHAPAPERFKWHALRHFAISAWIEADLKPKTVQTFAGHSSLQVTMDRYGHLFKSDDHGAAMDRIATGLL